MKKYEYECYYCGEPGDHRDHIVPSSYSQNIRHFETQDIVIACPECNQLLSNRLFSSMYERGRYLADRLSKRYRSTINMPEWTPVELRKLSPNLRASVEASIRDKEVLLRRIERLSEVREINQGSA
jgi:hypothetical protein